MYSPFLYLSNKKKGCERMSYTGKIIQLKIFQFIKILNFIFSIWYLLAVFVVPATNDQTYLYYYGHPSPTFQIIALSYTILPIFSILTSLFFLFKEISTNATAGAILMIIACGALLAYGPFNTLLYGTYTQMSKKISIGIGLLALYSAFLMYTYHVRISEKKIVKLKSQKAEAKENKKRKVEEERLAAIEIEKEKAKIREQNNIKLQKAQDKKVQEAVNRIIKEAKLKQKKSHKPHLGPKRILLISDDLTLQRKVKYNLIKEGYQLSICDDGLEGFNLLIDNDYDLAIIDWTLPDLSGLEIVETIRGLDKRIKILMISHDSLEQVITSAFKAGANDYISKPVHSNELEKSIHSLLHDIENNATYKTKSFNQSSKTFTFNKRKLKNIEKVKEDKILDITNRIKINYTKQEIYLDAKRVAATDLEYDLLIYLLENKNRYVSYKEILEQVPQFKTQQLDVYINALIQRLESPSLIDFKQGIGYKLNVS